MLSNRSTPKTRTVPEQVKNRTQTGRPKNTENIQFKKKILSCTSMQIQIPNHSTQLCKVFSFIYHFTGEYSKMTPSAIHI